MQITVEYAAQVKRAAGTARETLDLEPGASLSTLAQRVVELHGAALRAILLNEDGGMHPSILVFVNDEQCRDAEGRELTAGDVVAFLSPISGG